MQSKSEGFEEVLNKYGKLTYTNKGISMLPMLRPEKDAFTIVKKTEERCNENDVVLYKINGRYILHRIVKVFDDHYTILGDNCIRYEENIKDDDILGILTSFQRNGRLISVDDPRYRIYVFILRFLEKPRIIVRILIATVKRMIKKLTGF